MFTYLNLVFIGIFKKCYIMLYAHAYNEKIEG